MTSLALAARSGLDRLRFKKVDKVVALSVIGAVMLAWFVVVALDAMMAFVNEINDVGTGDYTLAKAVTYILLTIPRRMYQFFAYGGLIGGLMGMGALAASGELTALRAAGLSKLRICASVVLALTVLTVFVALMGELIAPRAQQKAEALALTAKNRDVTIGKGGTLWARDGEAVINAKRGRKLPNKNGQPSIELSDVRVFEFTPIGQLSALSIAKTATHVDGEWTLHDVRRTEFAGRSATSKLEQTAQWKSALDPSVLAVSMIHPEYLSMADLARNIDYMNRNRQDATSYKLAYWGRIFYPLNVLVLAFCAVPFAFGSLRTGGLGKRLFMGMALAISYYFFQKSVVSMGAVYNFNLAVVNALPSLFLAVAAFVYFRRNA
ncbi:MAG: LPS export ABC transporter permease LptG [Rudaea sp.]|uniref:LPS export ABC transporter permease LptG n=1 Tax=unclassified Rudaea TaxID=2627037 RepID=UPI0010F51F42|nr:MULTISPECIES: LPS export ABC transporter permease LptG [unclassified Rudaea]MBN8885894.1 LPS export ABC transporter permease LptG [Rudaea sp.]MBR0343766.1 LPS export ABC transporter permease LptG [Rudaea sp.]